MERKGQTAVITLLLVICLLLVLILMILLITPLVFTGKTVSSSKSYSSSNTKTCQTITIPYTEKETVCEYDSYRDYRGLDYRVDYNGYEKNYKDSGAYRNRYVVRVRNVDYKDGYFTVRFYFDDRSGDRVTKTVRKYLKSGAAENFYYPDYDSYSKNWDYKVFSDSSSDYNNYDGCYPVTKYVTKYRYEQRCY